MAESAPATDPGVPEVVIRGTWNGVDKLPFSPVLPHTEYIGGLAAGTAIFDGELTILEHMSPENGSRAPQEVIDQVVETARGRGVPEGQLPLMSMAAHVDYFWRQYGAK